MKLTFAFSSIRCAIALAFCTAAFGADATRDLPHLQKQGTATQLIVDGKPFLILGGQLHNSSSSSVEYMTPIWPKLTALNLNTVLAAVTWELIEPTEGKFDFRLVDGLLDGARKNHLRLVLLWYGSWKHAGISYAPPWVKTNLTRFPRMQNTKKANLDSLSPFSDGNKQADGKAFIALMHHLRQSDEKQHTVIMMQVEDEPGLLGDSRDRSPLAEEAFAKPVPAALIAHLQKNQATVVPEFAKYWQDAGSKNAGTWTEVFGEGADEAFMAWHVSSYVGMIASAGKADYPLPMYVNSGPVQNETLKPGQYPSGEPVSKVLDVWRAGAPAIDLIAPTITFVSDFKIACASYARSENPLFVPDASREPDSATKVFYAIGQHDAIGFCPNGIDSMNPEHPLKESYAWLNELIPIITPHQGKGESVGLLQTGTNAVERLTVAGYNVGVLFNTRGRTNAMHYGIIIATGPDEFVVAGAGFQAGFSAKRTGPSSSTRILSVEEGHFRNGTWVAGRRLNGDETSGGARVILRSGAPSIQKVRLYRQE